MDFVEKYFLSNSNCVRELIYLELPNYWNYFAFSNENVKRVIIYNKECAFVFHIGVSFHPLYLLNKVTIFYFDFIKEIGKQLNCMFTEMYNVYTINDSEPKFIGYIDLNQ